MRSWLLLAMRFSITLFLLLCVFPVNTYAQGHESTAPRQIGDPRRFDEWGDIPFSDEKARLDNIAIHLEHEPDLIVYLVIFAGRRACVGEAQARGIRAKNYLVRKRGINPERVIWIDGGFRDEVTTEISLWPPQVGKPSVFPEFNLKPSEVKLERNCRIKYRGYKALKN